MADVGKDLCRSSCPSPLLKERSTRTGTQDFVQLHFENLQPFRQPVPVITLTVKHLLGKTDFKLNVFVCRTWLNLSATTVSPSSFIRYKDGYSEHTSGFIVFRNSEITKSYHTLRGKLTKEKRKPLSDSILILRDQRCALLSSTEIKWKKREKEKTKNLSWYHYIDKSHYCTSTFSADAKIIHVAIACITSAAFCPSILYSRSPLPALKVLLVWKLYFFTEVYLCSLSKERIHSNIS